MIWCCRFPNLSNITLAQVQNTPAIPAFLSNSTSGDNFSPKNYSTYYLFCLKSSPHIFTWLDGFFFVCLFPVVFYHLSLCSNINFSNTISSWNHTGIIQAFHRLCCFIVSIALKLSLNYMKWCMFYLTSIFSKYSITYHLY